MRAVVQRYPSCDGCDVQVSHTLTEPCCWDNAQVHGVVCCRRRRRRRRRRHTGIPLLMQPQERLVACTSKVAVSAMQSIVKFNRGNLLFAGVVTYIAQPGRAGRCRGPYLLLLVISTPTLVGHLLAT